MAQLQGTVALITGAATGIGRGIARAFAAEGARLILASRDGGRLEEAASELRARGAQAIAAPTDVTDEAQVAALFQRAMAEFGRIDVLVNNAGAFDGGPLDELSLETWQKVIGVNLTGPFLCSREAFRIMKAQGGGRIINIGSISAQVPRMGSAPYTSSKFGLEGLTRATALDGRAHGIVASCLHPGNIATERRQASDARRAGICRRADGVAPAARQPARRDRPAGRAALPRARVSVGERAGQPACSPPWFTSWIVKPAACL
jgi:NAD(P)-dependent dehydrogenase (short-subunit alcohol dehydrogenase family)